MAADYVTLERVPVLMTGTWNASTGQEPITDEDLASITEAYAAGVLDPAVIKIGHSDPRFNTYLEDGEPAYGQVTNPTIDDGVLYVDYKHMPATLAESLESAYPRCSVELARNVELRDPDGNITHQFPVALTAVALLGATAPAVKGLSTKKETAALAADNSDYITEIRISEFSFPGGNTARSLEEKLSAVVHAAYSGEGMYAYLYDFDDTTAIYVVEDYSDTAYYRQTYTTGANGVPEFTGAPEHVIKETRWVSENDDAAAPAVPTPTGLSMPTTNPIPEPAFSEKRHDSVLSPQTAENGDATGDAPPTSTKDHEQGDPTMATVDKDTAKELRTKYELPDNSSYEDILAAVLEDQDSKGQENAGEKKNVAPGSDETPVSEVVEQQAEESAKRLEPFMSEGGAPTGEGSTTIDASKLAEELGGQFVSASAFAEFQRDYAQTRAALAARDEADTRARRDELVSQWFRQGRVGPDDAKQVREALDKPGAEETVTGMINARPVLFTGSERGHGNTGTEFLAADTETETTNKLYEADDAVFGTAK